MKNEIVSIIVPVYGVENHIAQCFHSLMKQTYSDIQYILVDDASPDGSIAVITAILEQYPARQQQVNIVRHSVNKGLPAARNTGLSQATGEYIFHCDSDDWIEPTMIQDMVLAAQARRADIVYSDFYLSFHKNERYMEQPSYSDAESSLIAMLDGSMKFNVWNKLIRRRLYTDHEIIFPDGKSMGEDMTVLKLFCHAKRIAYLKGAYYHYVQTNANAFTKSISETSLAQIKANVTDVTGYIETVFGKARFSDALQYFKLNMKLPFLISLDYGMYRLWRTWYPTANGYIGKNPAFSFRTRFIQYMALYKQFWLVYLYNIFIMKVVYGILYR
ncbi:glycosyltransferase family 2 protein [Sphingobacterium kitahiroshimense]|uniref:Glycosyltransferase family 2 protein n=1 Tax=Sphingobacterium kitahiroshimense TaxID=470446 RepID=A0ABV0BW64_9SPHI